MQCHFIVYWFRCELVKTDNRAFDRRRNKIGTLAFHAWKVNFLKKRWCRVGGEIKHENFGVNKLMRHNYKPIGIQMDISCVYNASKRHSLS